MSEPYLISAMLTPILGAAVDARGGRATLVGVSACLLTAVHLALGFSALPAAIALAGLGVGYSIFA